MLLGVLPLGVLSLALPQWALTCSHQPRPRAARRMLITTHQAMPALSMASVLKCFAQQLHLRVDHLLRVERHRTTSVVRFKILFSVLQHIYRVPFPQ